MSTEEIQHVRIRYRSTAFEAEGGDTGPGAEPGAPLREGAAARGGEEPTSFPGFDGECPVPVVRLDARRLRVVEPTSLSPFGPLGPTLQMGQIVEVRDRGDGTLAYVRSLETPPVRERVISSIRRGSLEDEQVESLLADIRRAGAGWEWSAGTITIQWMPKKDEPDLSAGIERRIDRLASRLAELRPDGRS